MDTKPWYKSKTMWFNIATVVAAGTAFVSSNPAAFLPFLPEQSAPVILAVVGVINVMLRAVTTTGVSK